MDVNKGGLFGPRSQRHALRSVDCRFWVAAAAVIGLGFPGAALAGTAASRSQGPHADSTEASPPANQTAAGSSSTRSGQSRPPNSGAGRRLAATVLVVPGSGYRSAHGSALVRVIQRRLAQAGFAPGPVDGRYGPLTLRSVLAFQASHSLRVDGIVGRRTWAALTPSNVALVPGAGDQPGGSELVRALQRRLALAGYQPGPADGHYGPVTERAVRRFQAAHRLRASGIAGPRTLARALEPTHSARSQSQHQSHASGVRSAHGQRGRIPAGKGVTTPTDKSGGPATALLVVLGALALLVAALIAARLLTRRSTRSRASSQDGPTEAPATATAHQRNLVESVDQLAAVAGSGGAERLGNGNGNHAGVATATQDRSGQRPGAHAAREGGAGEAGDAFNLGLLLERQGTVDGALAAYRRAEQGGHGAAASNLGVLLQDQGAAAEAETAYRRADQSGEPTGAFNLGVLLHERGDVAEAESAYRRAERRGHGAAASNLGVLLEERGAPTEAEAAYRRADQRGEATGAFNLGLLLQERGALAEAETAYRRAEQRGDDEVVRAARAALRDLDGTTRQRSADWASSRPS